MKLFLELKLKMNELQFNVFSKEKDIEELFREIENINKNNNNLHKIKNIFIKIKNKYICKYKNDFFSKEKEREYFRTIIDNIYEKTSNNKFDFYISLIPILIKGCSLKFGYEPRDIQIIALLFFLFKDVNKGLIEQIYTGEGKTVIISFLATIKALEGKKVDILTSSCVLAERDAKEMKEFYNLFGLSVDYCKTNNDIELNDSNLKNFKCYDADIVYGDTLSLEGDILRSNFMGIVGRGNKRPFDCIIIDEIDNICIDNIKNTTELLDNFHGYKFLEYIYLYIYNQLLEIDKNIKQKLLIENQIENYQLFIFNNRNNIIKHLIEL